jgi:hypothetical protein
MSHFKKIIGSYKTSVNLTSNNAWELIESMGVLFEELETEDKEKFWETMKDMHEEIKGKHFDEMYAKHEVSEMYHTKPNGTICRGEIVSIDEASMVYEKYRRSIDNEVTVWDVYVALNAQAHDYSALYHQWFSDNEVVKDKIIESAIVFWFKDEDHSKGKVWDYFDE